MDLEGIMLNEINQTEKDKFHISHVECKEQNKIETDFKIQRID